jgi:hypothetical protein
VIIVVASIKGAPGVTTTATAIASAWPQGRRVLLVEADPFGGDLAAWFGVAPTTGLWSLLAAGRRGIESDAVWKHSTTLPGGLPVLYGLASADQAVANEAAWPAVAEALAALEADVIIDAGRLLPHLAGGIRPLLSLAEMLVVLCPPTLAGIVHLKTSLPSLVAGSPSGRLIVQPTAEKGFSSDEIASTLTINVAPPIPHDPKGAAALSRNAIGWANSKAALAKWARANAAGLAGFVSGPAATQDPLSIPGIRDPPPRPPVDDPESLDHVEHLHDTERLNDTERLQNTVHSDAPTWAAR